LMGLIAFNAGQYDHSLEWLARAIAQDPKPDFIASLGATLLRQGRREDALKAFDKAVQLKPDDASLWKQLA
jgi:tetratricopeptide (TPR) repeat protein